MKFKNYQDKLFEPPNTYYSSTPGIVDNSYTIPIANFIICNTDLITVQNTVGSLRLSFNTQEYQAPGDPPPSDGNWILVKNVEVCKAGYYANWDWSRPVQPNDLSLSGWWQGVQLEGSPVGPSLSQVKYLCASAKADINNQEASKNDIHTLLGDRLLASTEPNIYKRWVSWYTIDQGHVRRTC